MAKRTQDTMARLALGSLLLLLTGGMCHRDAADVADIAEIRSSPCDADVAPVRAPVAKALTGRPSAEREVHDCQRLVVDDAYGPRVGIYPILDAIEQPTDAFAEWTAVASVFKWGRDDYTPLLLTDESSCLFLRVVDGKWQAHVAPLFNCPERTLPPDEEPNLDVVARQYTGPEKEEPNRPIYPLTARFGWDPAGRQHYFGIKCGDNWCSIGPAAALPPDSPIPDSLFFKMPGYFDEQPMPIVRNGVVTVGPVVRLHPSDSLRLALADEQLWRKTVTYATVVLDTAGVPAADRTLLETALNLGGQSSSDSRHCGHADHGRAIGACLVMDVDAKNAVSRRWGSIGQSKFLAFDVSDPQQHAAPGTVRWRWREVAGAPAPQPLQEADVPVTEAGSGESAPDTATAPTRRAAFLMAAASAAAAAWIPCQGDNCCTAVW